MSKTYVQYCNYFLYSESACSPVCVSVISDLFPDTMRGVATAVLHLGVYLGFGLSQAAGIYLTQLNILGFSWRVSYFITGVPGIIFSILLLFLNDDRNCNLDSINNNSNDPTAESCKKLLSSPQKIAKSADFKKVYFRNSFNF